MKISIIIPTLNPKASDLKKALSSCFSQTVPADEVMIVDGGSANIAEIESLLAFFPSTRLIKEHDIILIQNRKIGIENAIGDYLIFLDCDDALSPFFVEAVHHFEAEEADVLLFGSGSAEQHFSPDYSQADIIKEKDLIYQYFLRLKKGPTKPELRSFWAKAFRKSFLKENGLPNDLKVSQGEDQLTMYWVSFLAQKIVSLPSFLSYRYVIHPYSMSVVFSKTKVAEFTYLASKLKECLCVFGWPKQKSQEFYFSVSCEYSVRLLQAYFCNLGNPLPKKQRFSDFRRFLKKEKLFNEAVKKCHLSTCPTSQKKKMLLLLKLGFGRPIFDYYEQKQLKK
jgi:glycosyltransferase involved in cell wall biosynthesis